MTTEKNPNDLDYKITPVLHRIYSLEEYDVDFYMKSTGAVYWSSTDEEPKLLKFLPERFQIPFLIKFIRNHSLSEKLKFIKDPLISIEMYIKAKYLTGEEKLIPI